MFYKGIELFMFEGTSFTQTLNDGSVYSVNRKDGLVFEAASEFGHSYAIDPEQALAGAKKQIDAALG